MFGLVPFDRKKSQLQNASEDRDWDIDRIFENFFNDAIFPSFYNRSGLMRVDVSENEKAYVLEAELPGISKDQVNIEINDDRLTISVDQDENDEVKDENYIRRERRRCSMTRSFSIDNIDTEKISAKMDNGILKLELPKREPTKKAVKKIDIR
jgi:HSP20 family protein